MTIQLYYDLTVVQKGEHPILTEEDLYKLWLSSDDRKNGSTFLDYLTDRLKHKDIKRKEK